MTKLQAKKVKKRTISRKKKNCNKKSRETLKGLARRNEFVGMEREGFNDPSRANKLLKVLMLYNMGLFAILEKR